MEPTTIQSFKRDYSVNLNNSEFKSVINDLLLNNDIDEIIETGAFNGLGSTSVFAETKKYVFSIECNYNNYVTATRNLQLYDNVCVIHGLSLNRKDLIDILLHEKFDIETKYDSDFPKTFYMREINQQVVLEDALDVFCNNDRRQLIFLDSAGGVGYAEFHKILQLPKNFLNKKILVLDDISHIKHKRSVEELESLGYKVNKSKDNRFAWSILEIND
jgi:hypothetical protein